MNMQTIKNNLIKNLILTLVYAIFTLFIVFHHEIWADEAQVWLLCKNLNVIELFKHLVNEGHPAFFYLLVMPFAKILHGTSAILSMQLICWFASTIAVFLLWQFSPFNKWTKAAITLSAGFLYFFPVIARSYSLIPLVVFLLAIIYPKRHEKPIIYGILTAICANIHVIMFGFSSMLAMLFIYESFNSEKQADISNKSKNPIFSKVFSRLKSLSTCEKAGMTIMILGLLAVVLQLHGTTSSNAFINFDTSDFFTKIKHVLTCFFMNAYDAGNQIIGEIMLPIMGIPLIILSVIIYVILWIQLFINSKKLFVIAFLGVAFQLFIYIFTYSYLILVPRIFCAHLILLFAFWVVFSNSDFVQKTKFSGKKTINILIAIFFFITTLNGLKYSILDVFNNYSGAKEAGAFIEKNIDPKNSILITDNPLDCNSLIYYLEKNKVFSVFTNEYIKYVVWDKKINRTTNAYFWTEYMRAFSTQNKNKRLFLVLEGFHKYELKINKIKGFKKIFQSKPAIFKREEYVIYEYEG